MKRSIKSIVAITCIFALILVSLSLVFVEFGSEIAFAIYDNQDQVVQSAYQYVAIDWNVEDPNKLSTNELLERLLSYPNLDYWMLYYNEDLSIKHIQKEYNGLEVLLKRSDLVKTVTECVQKNNSMSVSKKIALRALLSYNYSNTTVYTVYNSSVPAKIYDELSSFDILAINTSVSSLYPNATKLRDASHKYNCHSYAWYNRNISNYIWIDYPLNFKTDGFSITTTWATGDIVLYTENGGDDIHSAVIISTDGTQAGTIVDSKWGQAGLYRHSLNYCPYTNYSITVYRCAHVSHSATLLNSSTHTCACTLCGTLGTYIELHTLYYTSVNNTAHMCICSQCGYSYADTHNINPRTGRCYDCGFNGSGISPNSGLIVQG